MRRTDVLKLAALAPCAPLILGSRSAPALSPRAAAWLRRRVRPTDAAWPSKQSWQSLNQAVGGNLLEVQPLVAPCVHESGSAACADVMQHLRNPFFLGDQPAGTQVSGWLDAWTPAPSVLCDQGPHQRRYRCRCQFRTRSGPKWSRSGSRSWIG